MYWDFSKKALYSLLCLAALLVPVAKVRAETGIVSGTGYGKDVPEATAALLRSVILKNFKNPESTNLLKSVIQQEIIPNTSAFVQSYRVLEGGNGKPISLSASVDLEVVRSLISVTPQQLQDEEGAKILIVVQGAALPEPQKAKEALNPFQALELAGWDRFQRRGFAPVKLSDKEVQEVGDDQVSSPEFLRGLGAKAGARLALGISGKFEQFENENSHNKETKLVLVATLYDVKNGRLMAKETMTVNTPKSRKDQYASDLQKILQEESKSLYHEVLVDAGSKLGKNPEARSFVVLRISGTPSYQLINKFRMALEAHKDIRGLVEYSIGRGAYDFSVRPVMPAPALVKILKGITADDFTVTALANPDSAASGEKAEEPSAAKGQLPLVSVELAEKNLEPSGETKNEN